MPHRYWKLSFLLGWNPNNTYAEFSEIEFRASVGGADITGGGTASASATSSGSAANLFDNNTSTVWHVNLGFEAIDIVYDFGTPVDVVEVYIEASSSATQSVNRRRFALLNWSDDGAQWTLLGPPIPTEQLHTGASVTQSGFAEPAEPRVVGENGILLGTTWPTGIDEGRLVGEAIRNDEIDGGALEISGTVMIDDSPDIPVRRRVRLFEKQSGRLIRETFSEVATGEYVFSNLKNQKYFVVAHDHTLFYNAVIKDEITPEVPA